MTRRSELRNLAELSATLVVGSGPLSGDSPVSTSADDGSPVPARAGDDATLSAGEWVCTLGVSTSGAKVAWLARVLEFDEETEETALQHFEVDKNDGTLYTKNTTAAGKWSEHRSCTFTVWTDWRGWWVMVRQRQRAVHVSRCSRAVRSGCTVFAPATGVR